MFANTQPIAKTTVLFIDPELTARILLDVDRWDGELPEPLEKAIQNNTVGQLIAAGMLPAAYLDSERAIDVLMDQDADPEYRAHFTGQVSTAYPQMTDKPISENLNDVWLLYWPFETNGHPAKTPAEIATMVNHFKTEWARVIPANFDWAARICNISGTYRM